MTVIGIITINTVGCDFIDFTAAYNGNCAVFDTCIKSMISLKAFFCLFGQSVCTNICIMRSQTETIITNTTAHYKSLIALIIQLSD